MSKDPGLQLELRAQRLAWKLGYFTRGRVKVYTADQETLTDIDVIGIRFDRTLNPEIVVFETKHENGYSSILKLKGFLDYFFQTKSGYIIRSSITSDVIQLAEQLGIRGMPISRLSEIEKQLGIDEAEWKLGYSEVTANRVEEFVKELVKKDAAKSTYLRHYFWSGTDPFYRLKNLKEQIQMHTDRLHSSTDQPLRNALSWLISDITCLFSVSLLECASILFTLPEQQRQSYFSRRLISGKLSHWEKEKLIDGFFEFLVKYERERKKRPAINRKDLDLLPDYAEDLYGILSRLIRKPEYSINISRLLDVHHFIRINSAEPNSIAIRDELLLTDEEFEYAAKFVRDIISFLFGRNVPIFYDKLMKV